MSCSIFWDDDIELSLKHKGETKVIAIQRHAQKKTYIKRWNYEEKQLLEKKQRVR